MFELRVEFRPAPGGRAIHLWHVVHAGESAGLCGRALSPGAGTLPIVEIVELRAESRCVPPCLSRDVTARGLTRGRSVAPSGCERTGAGRRCEQLQEAVRKAGASAERHKSLRGLDCDRGWRRVGGPLIR